MDIKNNNYPLFMSKTEHIKISLDPPTLLAFEIIQFAESNSPTPGRRDFSYTSPLDR